MAVFLLNRAPTKSLENRTPTASVRKKPRDIQDIRLGDAKNMRPHLSKLEDRSTPMVFIGYAAGTKGYKVFDSRTRVCHAMSFIRGAKPMARCRSPPLNRRSFPSSMC